MAASVGGHEGNAGKRTLTLSDVQGPAVVVLSSRPYQVSDHLVSKGACFDVVAELHRTEIFGLGVAAVRHVAVVGHGRILLRAGRHGYWSTSCNVTPPPSAFPCALSFPCP